MKCFWLEDGRCYLEPCVGDINGNSLKKCIGVTVCQEDKSGIKFDTIDIIANEKAKNIDWDDPKNASRYEGIYVDGFMAGALWMKKLLKERLK